MASTTALMDLLASSFAGIGKSTGRGSLLVSTIAMTGMPNFLASARAMCSFITSTMKTAAGMRFMSEMEPRFFSSLVRWRLTCRRSRLDMVFSVPSASILSIWVIFRMALRIVAKLVSMPPDQRSVT